MFGKIKHSNEYKTLKKMDYNKPSNAKQMDRVQNIRIKYGNTNLPNVWKYKWVRSALEVFAPTCLY